MKIFLKKYSKLFFCFYKSRVNNSNLINSQQGSRGVVARIAAFQAGVPGSIPGRFHIFALSHKDQRLSHFFHSHRHISTQIFLVFFYLYHDYLREMIEFRFICSNVVARPCTTNMAQHKYRTYTPQLILVPVA